MPGFITAHHTISVHRGRCWANRCRGEHSVFIEIPIFVVCALRLFQPEIPNSQKLNPTQVPQIDIFFTKKFRMRFQVINDHGVKDSTPSAVCKMMPWAVFKGNPLREFCNVGQASRQETAASVYASRRVSSARISFLRSLSKASSNASRSPANAWESNSLSADKIRANS